MSNTKTVGVVSHHNEGTGGFWWFPEGTTREALDAAFDKEVAIWTSAQGNEADTTIRLVMVEVPAHLDGEELTIELDSDIDALEIDLPALREIVTR